MEKLSSFLDKNLEIFNNFVLDIKSKSQKINSEVIHLDPGCSLSCIFCPGKEKQKNEIIKNIEINLYQAIRRCQKEKIKNIFITGMDPLEYEHIVELISFVKKNFDFVSLDTNGTMLSSSILSKRIIFSGVDEIKIPLYGSSAKIHDSITRTSGSFNRAILGIKNLLKERPTINIAIKSLVLKQNKNDLLNIANLVNRLKIKFLEFKVPHLNVADIDSFYIPIKNLGPYVKKIYNNSINSKIEITFFDVPYCVFGAINKKNIKNNYQYNQPITKNLPLPSCQIKRKIKMCGNCQANNYCAGFFVDDVNKFGTGELSPIR